MTKDLEGLPVSPMEVIDESSRRFVSWASVDVVDKEGEVIPMSELRRVMPNIMERGGPVMDSHSNKHVGKILNYQFTTKEVDGEEKDALLVLGKIFDHTSIDDRVWNAIKNEEYRGMSFGGAAHDTEVDLDYEDAGPAELLREIEGYEWSVVPSPMNQESTMVAFNELAKGHTGLVSVAKGEGLIKDEGELDVYTLLKQELSSDARGALNRVFSGDEDVGVEDVVDFFLGDVGGLLAKGDDAVGRCISHKVGEEGWSQERAVAACLSMKRRGDLKSSEKQRVFVRPSHVLYGSRERALEAAEELGLGGVHSHEVDGEELFMPGESHEEYRGRVRVVQHVKDEDDEGEMKQGEGFDMSACMDAVSGEEVDGEVFCRWFRQQVEGGRFGNPWTGDGG